MSTASKGVIARLKTIPAKELASKVVNIGISLKVSTLLIFSLAMAKEVNCDVPIKALGKEAVAPLKNPRN